MNKNIVIKYLFVIIILLPYISLNPRGIGLQKSAAAVPTMAVQKAPQKIQLQPQPASHAVIYNDAVSLYDWFLSLTHWNALDDEYFQNYQSYFSPVQINQIVQKKATVQKQPQPAVVLKPQLPIVQQQIPKPILTAVNPSVALPPQSAISKPQSKPSKYVTLQAAGVLAIVYDEDKDKREVLLGREAFKGGVYGYFGGEGEQGDKNNALSAAQREFYEEALLGQVFGWNESDVGNYIKNNIKGCIITATKDSTVQPNGYSYAATYIVDMGKQNTNKLLNNFMPVRMRLINTKAPTHLLEMDRIISVFWNDFENYLKDFKNKKLIPQGFSSPDTNDNNGIRVVNGLMLKTMFEPANKVNVNDARFPLGVYVYFSEKVAPQKYNSINLSKLALQEKNDYENEMVALYDKICTQLFGN